MIENTRGALRSRQSKKDVQYPQENNCQWIGPHGYHPLSDQCCV